MLLPDLDNLIQRRTLFFVTGPPIIFGIFNSMIVDGVNETLRFFYKRKFEFNFKKLNNFSERVKVQVALQKVLIKVRFCDPELPHAHKLAKVRLSDMLH